MIWGLCESPITFNAIIGWSNALNEGRMQLREILDLEAMLSKGPTAEQIAATEEGGEGAAKARSARRSPARRSRKRKRSPTSPRPTPTKTTRTWSSGAPSRRPRRRTRTTPSSLAQMEETLKPQALEKFAEITSIFKKFRKVQAHRMEALRTPAQDFPAADEKKYQKLREQLTAEVESVQFHG